MTLQVRIETAYDGNVDAKEALDAFDCLMEALNLGDVRAAEKSGSDWIVNSWVKKGILLGFRIGVLQNMSVEGFPFFDKNTFPLHPFSTQDEVRIVPGGSAIRNGCHVGNRVTCLPPMYINVGAYVDEGTMIDSHALVGSCAQIGKRVHLSAGSQIGGVIEPIGARPVIVEDDVLVGGNCGLYEGVLVRKGAVIGAGTIITGSTPVFDVVQNCIYKKTVDGPLEIPENAVVVPGTRPLKKENPWGLSIYTPIIIKYRDEKTESGITLETLLR